MGRRKLRFDARKNFERKKYSKSSELTVSIPLVLLSVPSDDANPSELIVSLPMSAYTSSPVPDASALHSRVSRSTTLPAGWTLACLPEASGSNTASLVLCKLQILPPLFSADLTLMLTVTPDCAWTLSVGRSQINQQQCQLLCGIAAKLCCVDEVVKLLTVLDGSKFCVGNPDAKFMQLIPRQKGSFRDQSGKSLSASLLYGNTAYLLIFEHS